MILDSSAVVAVLTGEEDAAPLAGAMAGAQHLSMTAANWLEAAMVIEGRRDPVLSETFHNLIEVSAVELVAVDAPLARRALDAWRAFGKGRHPAALNFGDCFAYALAQERGEPLLYKGEDFARTDVKPAL